MDEVQEPNVPHVDVSVVKQAMDTQEPCVILDVRTAGEYARSHIEGSTHLPIEEVAEKVLEVVPDMTTKIYVYCLSGSRSIVAVEIMEQMGYTNVFDVSHGLLAWRIKQYPLTS